MGFRELIGEVDGRDVIEIGDVVNVWLGKGREIYGRLNKVSEKEIKVGAIKIKVDNIINIKKCGDK